MIDCTKCIHWDCFAWHAVIWHRLTDGGFWDEATSERVETCRKGLSEMEGGRTMGHTVARCERYSEVGDCIR